MNTVLASTHNTFNPPILPGGMAGILLDGTTEAAMCSLLEGTGTSGVQVVLTVFSGSEFPYVGGRLWYE